MKNIEAIEDRVLATILVLAVVSIESVFGYLFYILFTGKEPNPKEFLAMLVVLSALFMVVNFFIFLIYLIIYKLNIFDLWRKENKENG